jgi:hypothetical protein
MAQEVTHLPATSQFAKAVFKQIRPHIPRQVWPQDVVRASFTPSADGFSLRSHFDSFPAAYAAEAAAWVRQGGLDLVLASPAGWAAARTFHVLRWRDTCLYALVPLLFAIPLSSILSGTAMKIAGALFAVDALALLATHLRLVRMRAALTSIAFSADIPSPGLRVRDLAPPLPPLT